MESTTTWEVPREHWATYLSQVAALQKDRPVKVELVGPELGEQTLTRLAHLRSLFAERKGATAGSIELDLGLNGELDHRIIHPVRLYAIEAPTGQLKCLDIEDESRTKTLIRFLQPLSLGAGTRGRPSRTREVLARDYMTSPPLVIRAGQSASQALELMQRHGIRHLPVVDPTEHLLGVVSDRDLYASKYGGPPAPRGGAVDEVMVRSPYVVSPSTRLDEAAAVMAKRKYGCAVVVDKERVVGILTTIDALRALVELRAKERGEQLV